MDFSEINVASVLKLIKINNKRKRGEKGKEKRKKREISIQIRRKIEMS